MVEHPASISNAAPPAMPATVKTMFRMDILSLWLLLQRLLQQALRFMQAGNEGEAVTVCIKR
jgi:hypothetical protein